MRLSSISKTPSGSLQRHRSGWPRSGTGRHDLRAGQAAGLRFAEGMAPQDVLLIHLVQGLHKDGLLADAAADGHLFQIQQKRSGCRSARQRPGRSCAGSRWPRSPRRGPPQRRCVHPWCIGGQALAGAVAAQQAAGTALAGNALCGVAPGIGVGVHKAVLACRAVPAAHQLPINDQAAAHTGADDEHCCVPAAFSTPASSSAMAAACRHSRSRHGSRRPRPAGGQQACPHCRPERVPAAPDHTLLGIDKAWQTQAMPSTSSLWGR